MKLIILCLLSFTFSFSYSQKENYNWVLSNNTSIDFNFTPPKVNTIPNSLGHRSNIAALSNKQGQLLLYGDATSIYGSNHELLSNSGDNFRNHYYTAAIKSEDKIYFFSIRREAQSNDCFRKTHLVAEIFDKETLQHLKTTTLKKSCKSIDFIVLRQDSFFEFWLVLFSENKIYSFSVTKNGISETAIISDIEDVVPAHDVSKILISRAFDKIIFIASGWLHTVDFDAATGKFTNHISLWLSNADIVEFSPKGDLFYTSHILSGELKQYQTALLTDSTSLKKEAKILSLGYNKRIMDMQSAPDGRIYCLIKGSEYLSYIQNPDKLYPDCDFIEKGLFLSDTPPYRLPNIISDRSYIDIKTEECLQSITTFYRGVTPKSTLWHFGDSQTSTELSPTHTYEKAGTYTVSVAITYSDNSTETISKEIEIFENPKKLKIIYDKY